MNKWIAILSIVIVAAVLLSIYYKRKDRQYAQNAAGVTQTAAFEPRMTEQVSIPTQNLNASEQIGKDLARLI